MDLAPGEVRSSQRISGGESGWREKREGEVGRTSHSLPTRGGERRANRVTAVVWAPWNRAAVANGSGPAERTHRPCPRSGPAPRSRGGFRLPQGRKTAAGTRNLSRY